MIPIATSAPRPRRTAVTWGLILVNAAAFLFELGLPQPALEGLLDQLGIVPLRYSYPEWSAQQDWLVPGIVPFFTTMFLHGGWAHLIGNMWTLWIFGRCVEGRLGAWRFLAFYLVCGLAAGLLHAWLEPAQLVPAIGASGAIAGVMGAALLLFPRARLLMVFPIFFYPLLLEVPAVFYLGFWFLTQLLQGSASLVHTGAVGGVAWWAHVGGFLGGLSLLGWFLGSPRRRPPERPMGGPGEGPGEGPEKGPEKGPEEGPDLRPGHELLREAGEPGRRRLIVLRRGRP